MSVEASVEATTMRSARKGPDSLSSAERERLQERLNAAERRFLQVEGSLDQPERRTLWPELAALNTALGYSADAATCWLNALWDADLPPPDWMQFWIEGEAKTAPRKVTVALVDSWLGDTAPVYANLRCLLAYVLWAGGQERPPRTLIARLEAICNYFRQHEDRLPIRGIWLAWYSLSRHLPDGVTELRNVRRRVLDRLFASGLTTELDFPGLLRSGGEESSDTFRFFREWRVATLPEHAQEWLRRLPVAEGESGLTPSYADLIFAFAMARLGETAACHRLLHRARRPLAEQAGRGYDEAHDFLMRAYVYRIEQALAGKPHQGPLPPDLLRRLDDLNSEQSADARFARYVVDLLRHSSRILEPDEKVDPYAAWLPSSRSLDQELARLANMPDRKALAAGLDRLLREAPALLTDRSAAEARANVLQAAPELAPRIGEEFGLQMLERLGSLYDALPPARGLVDLGGHAPLLYAGLFTAAHYDQPGHVQALVGRFRRLLESQRGRADAVYHFNDVARQCFRGLRKLGLRDEIDPLLKQMADLILAAQNVPTLHALLHKTFTDKDLSHDGPLAQWVAALGTLLQLASSWYSFGRDAEAEPVLNVVGTVLSQGTLLDGAVFRPAEQAALACDYVAAVAEAPVDEVQRRLDELLHRLVLPDPRYTTSSHYSLVNLRLIEAIVMTVIKQDPSSGGKRHRWREEDEQGIRRRVYADFQALSAQQAL
jgi:hypothetical protein